MRPNPITRAAAGLAAILACGLALGQGVEQINIQGKRAMTARVVGRTSSGLPVADITLSYEVSTKGLDLASSAGAAELAKRIGNAARGACQEITRQHPNAEPSDAECAKVATDQAMVNARKLAK